MAVSRVWHVTVCVIFTVLVSYGHGGQSKKKNATGSSSAKKKSPPEYTIAAPPVLGGVSPNFIIRKEGQSVELFCEGSGTPDPSLTWYKDGKKIVSRGQVKVDKNRIKIDSLNRLHGGVYTCTFSNPVGKVSHIMKLVIEGHVYIMNPPKNTTVRKGQQVKLSCQAEGYPNNITYTWFKNSIDVQIVDGDLMKRAGTYGDGSFVISSVEIADMGTYTCRPSNGLGPPPEASAFLNITYLPLVLNMQSIYYLPRGLPAQLSCPVQANPPATMVVWTKDTRTIDFQHSKRLKRLPNGGLGINAVSLSDEGHYRCQPYNSLGAGFVSRLFQVLVKAPPHFVIRPQPYYQRQEGQAVTIACRAEGDPDPSIIWRKTDGGILEEKNIHQDGGNLTIVDLREKHDGIYECIATNSVTSVVTVTRLIIEKSKAHPAVNVTMVTGQFWAKISWVPAYNAGYELHYILWYRMVRQTKRNPWQTIRIKPSTVTSFTVYNLFPDTEYEFTLLSRNKLGDGLFSREVTARTAGLLPNQTISTTPALENELTSGRPGRSRRPGKLPRVRPIIETRPMQGPKAFPPRNLTVQRRQQGLHIHWFPPQNRSVNISFYVIEYRTVGPWLRLNGDIKGATSYFWKNPSRGVNYAFRITAYTDKEYSTPSKVVLVSFIDIKSGKLHLNMAVVGGVIGGLAFLFAAIILSLIATKLRKRRHKRGKPGTRYGNVKYFDPNHVDGNKKKAMTDGHRDVNPRLVKHKRLSMEMAEEIL